MKVFFLMTNFVLARCNVCICKYGIYTCKYEVLETSIILFLIKRLKRFNPYFSLFFTFQSL